MERVYQKKGKAPGVSCHNIQELDTSCDLFDSKHDMTKAEVLVLILVGTHALSIAVLIVTMWRNWMIKISFLC